MPSNSPLSQPVETIRMPFLKKIFLKSLSEPPIDHNVRTSLFFSRAIINNALTTPKLARSTIKLRIQTTTIRSDLITLKSVASCSSRSDMITLSLKYRSSNFLTAVSSVVCTSRKEGAVIPVNSLNHPSGAIANF